jgi:hypothetical protein
MGPGPSSWPFLTTRPRLGRPWVIMICDTTNDAVSSERTRARRSMAAPPGAIRRSIY